MTSSAPDIRTHDMVHETTVSAPARAVYDLIADVSSWPHVFGPTVHVERSALGPDEERLLMWAVANDEVRSWTSLRRLDPERLRITFRQEKSPAPLLHMGGTWELEPLSENTTRVLLHHDFRTVHDDPAEVALVERAVDRNSVAELAALKRVAELGESYGDLVLSFEDSVTIDAPAALVYDFLRRAGDWPSRLPHVVRLELTEPAPDLQTMTMDTRGPDGSVHTTTSVRVCFPHDRIVYKQTGTPPIMAAHTGRWTLLPTAAGVEVVSQHTVVIRPERVLEVLGADGTVAGARELIRRALGTNSSTTLRHAKTAAEARV
jgi:aromatase